MQVDRDKTAALGCVGKQEHPNCATSPFWEVHQPWGDF